MIAGIAGTGVPVDQPRPGRSSSGRGGYVVYADFPTVGGLKAGSVGRDRGVRIGRVESIGLEDYQARVGLRIDDGVKLQKDAIASIKTKGLIGEKFVQISPGGSDKLVPTEGASPRSRPRSTSRS